jgi:hypothetical protein
LYQAMDTFFVAAATDSITSAAATSPTAAATRGYSPPETENFSALLGTVGAANDVVTKFRVGPLHSGQQTPWPPELTAPGFQDAALATFAGLEAIGAAAAGLLAEVVRIPALHDAIPLAESSSILSLNRSVPTLPPLFSSRWGGGVRTFCCAAATSISWRESFVSNGAPRHMC